MPTTLLPSYQVERRSSPPPRTPLRTDIAAFVGAMGRGPVRTATRIGSREEAIAMFGPPAATVANRSVAAYFENGGTVAYILRLANSTARTATSTLAGPTTGPEPTLRASSPGSWANRTAVRIARRDLGMVGGSSPGGTARAAQWNIRVAVPGDRVVVQAANSIDELEVLLGGALPIVCPFGSEPFVTDGPTWSFVLDGGVDGASPGPASYHDALCELLVTSEVAMLCFPGLWADLGTDAALEFLGKAAVSTAAALDRLLVLDLPEGAQSIPDVHRALDRVATRVGPANVAAVYHPWLKLEDGDLPAVPPCGVVAGTASALDRVRGAARTPANVPLVGVTDVVAPIGEDQLRSWYDDYGLNPIVCRPGGGVRVLGGRMTTIEPGPKFIAHRRLVHRLVRAIRQVAEPLVFEPNSRVLWDSIRRSITTVMLEAYRGGSLDGSSPDQAFQVRCDGSTTLTNDADNGRVVCTVSFCAANPIEWIDVLVRTTPQGALEVIEQ